MNIKFVFSGLLSIFVFTSSVSLANAVYLESNEDGAEAVNKEAVDELTEKLISETKYDDYTYPWVKNFNSSIKEITKLAVKEKLTPKDEQDDLKRIFDISVGNPSNENYWVALYVLGLARNENLSIDSALEKASKSLESSLSRVESLTESEIEAMTSEDSLPIEDYIVARLVLTLMTDEKLSLEDAGDKAWELLVSSLKDVRLYITAGKIQEIMEMPDTEFEKLLSEVRTDSNQDRISRDNEYMASNSPDSVFPSRSDSSTQESSEVHQQPEIIDPAKNIYELFGGDANVNKLLSAVPAKYKTLAVASKGIIPNLLTNERAAGNNPVVINWLVDTNDNGGLQKYAPGVKESLKNHSREGRSNCCLYSPSLITGDATVDLISSPQITNQNFSEDNVRYLIVQQYFIALATGHDEIIVPMSGFNVSKRNLVKIGNIYKKELTNSLFKGKFKKVIFVTGS